MTEANPPQESHANNDYGRENPLPPLETADVVMLFLSQCVNTRCLAKNNNTYWHLSTEYEHPKLKLNVSQLIITKIHLIIPVFTHNAHSNQKSEQM